MKHKSVADRLKDKGQNCLDERKGCVKGDGNDLHYVCGGGYTRVEICQISSRCTLNMEAFLSMQTTSVILA